MTFDEFVGGKSIAIVGPAPMPHDQSADIDGHDLVYRPAQAPPGGWYGDRTDIVFLNGGLGRTILDDSRTELRQRIDPVPWWVYKSQRFQPRPDGHYKRAQGPKLKHTGMNPNAVTMMLWDLLQYATGPISVFGADLYAAGPDRSYREGYYDRLDVPDFETAARGFLMHEPMKQMRVHRRIVATGRVVGDDRYLAAVSMTDDEYQAVIDDWQAALEEGR